MKSAFFDDFAKLLFLILLYFIQGIALGFFLGQIELVLTEAGITYTELSIVTYSVYPFSLKIFFSPIVETKYLKRVGKRRSWIIPMQITAAFLMIFLSYGIDSMIASKSIYTMTFFFFLIILCLSLQDIAVDGWAVEMLNEENVKYASTT